MSSKKSWRLKFVDIDASFSINTESSTVKGYMVVRAPKGEQSTYYFEKNNAEAIYAYIGLPTANWPDLYEAEAFNREYGLYISAPAGSSDEYPSYFGGEYLTTEGTVPLYNVSSKDTIDFTKKTSVKDFSSLSKVHTVVRKNIKSLYYDDANQTVNYDGSKESVAFIIGPIDSEIWGNLQEISFNYWGNKKANLPTSTKYYYLDKDSRKVYVEDESETPIKDYYCGTIAKEGSNYYVILGGGSWLHNQEKNVDGSTYKTIFDNGIVGIGNSSELVLSNNTSLNTEAPFFTLNDLINHIEEWAVKIGDNEDSENNDWVNVAQQIEGKEVLNFEGPYGSDFPLDNAIASIGDKVNDFDGYFSGLINIKSKTFAVINQKSPCEKTTNVILSNIGYDKWLYDQAVPFVYGSLSSISKNVFVDNDIKAFLYKENLPEAEGNLKLSLLEFNKDLKGTSVADCVTDIGTKNVSQDFLITKVYNITENTISVDTESNLNHKIVYCASKSSFIVETEDDKNYPLRKDVNFNTITFKVTEEIYPGQDTSGGEFHGSLSEKGKDANGANIYWPNVLNPNDFSFIEITPINTFDEFIDNNGIYIGKRIIDDKLIKDFSGSDEPIGNSKKLTLKGQRYVTHIVEQNIKEGKTGGAWRDEFWTVIQQGWNEAEDTNYDDVYVFMDPTGQEAVHTMQSSLVSGTHQLAIAISPKIITKPEFSNPSSIIVTARNKQCAQYAGEFKMYDEYTGKSFWSCPIGDIGLMCARIFDKKMGGWPPAWYNYNNLGGQLSRSVLEARWRFSDSATQILDTKGINPIVYNEDGLMVTSSKTTQDPNNLTDWSFLEHVMAFVLLKRDIRDNVMRPQIDKPIDDYFMDIRQTQVDAILAKRTSGSNKIWTSAVCDIKGVNNDVTKAQRKFCILVKVKVTPFAQEVELTLENVAQTTVL